MYLKKFENFLTAWGVTRVAKQGWLKNVLIGFFFVLALSYFLYSREVRIDHIELNSIADRYIIAQTGFEFPDTEATRLLREESIRDLGKIYYLNDREITKVEKKIQDDLVQKPHWRHTLPTVTFEDLIKANDTVRDVLLKTQFTDARTIGKLKQIGQCCSNCVIYTPEQLTEVLPQEIWKQIELAAFPSATPAAEFMLQQYRSYPWFLQEDLAKRNSLRELIKNSIPLKMTKVGAGSRIINTGEKVTVRHMDMMKGMKKSLLQQRHAMTYKSLLGSFILALILTAIALIYLKTLYPHVLQSSSKKILIGALIIFVLCLSRLMQYLLISKEAHMADLCRYPVIVPFITLTLAILIERKSALIISLFTTLMLSIAMGKHSYHFLIINVISAVVATVLVHTVRKRKEIFEICAKIWLVTVPLVMGTHLMENGHWDYRMLAYLLTTLICMAFIGILVIAILPLLESMFGIVTDMTLLESADLSHPLLRRLNLETPGTYRHSLAVAALAEEAALAINANPVFCRVASLYHDIGKLAQPQYFTENQFSGFNMHQLLTPLESAQVIITHVTEGVKLAEQYELPSTLVDVIREHHGTGLVYYFYHAQIEQCRVKAVSVEESRFRYPGPTPRSREAAIIMLADSIEAAFRCLAEVTEKAVFELVESIVNDKIREHQLDSSNLTFEEIESIKKAVVRALIATAHGRVRYPEKGSASLWKNEGPFGLLS